MGIEKIFNVLSGGGPISPFTALVVLLGLFGLVVGLTGFSTIGIADGMAGPTQAGVSVSEDSERGRITVTWTSNQNADYLDIVVTDSSSGAPVQTARLGSVGESVSLWGGNDVRSVQMIVTAVNDDGQTVIYDSTRQV